MFKTKKFIGRIIAFGAMCTILTTTASAKTFVVENNMRVPVTTAYEFSATIAPSAEYEAFNGASDIFCDEKNYIYVADTNNNRILKFDKNGKTIASYKNEGEKGFNAPEGVFVQEDGDIFVADTGNSRIVHITQNDAFVEQFIKPESNLLSDDFAFQPSKIGISSTNLIYVLNKTNFEGVFTLDANNKFCGYTCDNKVGTSIFDQLFKIFGSEYQKKMTQKRLPAVVTNFNVVGNNVFACTGKKGNVSGKIAEYTTVGKNLMQDLDYGISIDDYGKNNLSAFVDIDVSDSNIIAVLDQNNGKIFEYNRSGDQLAIFGSIGANRGEFDLPVALCYSHDGEIFVLDQSKGVIHKFAPTDFIKSVHQAISSYEDGKYSESGQKWQEVLEYDESYTLATQGIAKSYYKSEDYKNAAKYYRDADDKKGYSEAYAKLRHQLYRKYFVYIVLIVVTAVVLLYFAIRQWRRWQHKFFYGYYK